MSFDFVLKVDTDTYVNVASVERLLRQLNPEVPALLGRRMGFYLRPPFNASKPEGQTFCHGGAGYLLSRGLLRVMAERFERCIRVGPRSSLEDGRVRRRRRRRRRPADTGPQLGWCVQEYANITCTDRWYKRWDGFNNRLPDANETPESAAAAVAALANTSLLSARTFHKAGPRMHFLLHQALRDTRQWWKRAHPHPRRVS